MPSFTRASLVTRIGLLIGDPANQEWTAAQVQSRLDDAQETFVLDTRVLVDSYTDTVVAGTSEYSLQSDVLDIKRIAHKGIHLQRRSKFDLDALYGEDWTDNVGTPTSYYVDLDPDNQKIRLFPTPQAGDAGANLLVEYVVIPAALSADASVPFNGHTLMIPYYRALAFKTASDLLKENPDEQRLVKIRLYDKEYDELVAQCIETFKAMEETTPMRMRGGRFYKGIS